jgi:hypothetical protein
VSYLLSELAIYSSILVFPQLLLDERQQYRDNDAGLECLSKDNEENLRCEDVGHGDDVTRNWPDKLERLVEFGLLGMIRSAG